MFYVIASDLDGTLLTPTNRLTSFTKKILRSLAALKVHFIFATGRHYINLMKIRDNLNIYDYIITSNGARIYNSNNKLIASYNLDSEIAYDLLGIVHNDLKIVTSFFQEDELFSNRCQLNQKSFLIDKFYSYYEICKKNTLFLSKINKIYFTSNDCQRLLLLEQEINRRWNSYVNVSFSFQTCLEVIPGGISKGYALEQVVSLLGYQFKDCISFGDGMNDREMLEMTGKGCIMYNAQQRLKDTLPFLEVIGSNKNEAVPYYLKYMYFD